ncbi:MAG TPA: hypothetical protein VFX30_14095 [bacterium]|nr:hypothetical protein [bacterium]
MESIVLRVAGFQYVFFEAILGGSQVIVRGTAPGADRTCLVTEQKETTCNDGRDNDGDEPSTARIPIAAPSWDARPTMRLFSRRRSNKNLETWADHSLENPIFRALGGGGVIS